MARNRVLRKTKVIATIGPACDSLETIRDMIAAGMNVARLNFSHGDHEQHLRRLETIRRASDALGAEIAVMLDTKGVAIRTGALRGESADLVNGAVFDLYIDGRVGDDRGVSISFPDLIEDLAVARPVFVSDGRIELRVTQILDDTIRCEVIRGGTLIAHQGVNVPGTHFRRTAIGPEDRADLAFAVENDIEYIAASFVHSAADVMEIRKVLKERGSDIPIIAKIENAEGVRNLEEIIGEANGTMVARGDLGVEIPLRELPMVQKKIIRATVMNGKPVVTATQMLDSMERNPMPTRAEVSDVANAILDGTSAVMLSGETAAGAYPVEAVKTMASVALRAEASLQEYGHLQHTVGEPAHAVTDAVCQAAITLATHLDAAAIVTLTETGFTSRSISKQRPDCPILAITPSRDVVRKLSMNWGVTAMHFEGEHGDDAMIQFAVRRGQEREYLTRGDIIVVTAGRAKRSGSTDRIRVVTVT